MLNSGCGITRTHADICFIVALGSILAGCYTQVPHRSTLHQDGARRACIKTREILSFICFVLAVTLKSGLSKGNCTKSIKILGLLFPVVLLNLRVSPPGHGMLHTSEASRANWADRWLLQMREGVFRGAGTTETVAARPPKVLGTAYIAFRA